MNTLKQTLVAKKEARDAIKEDSESEDELRSSFHSQAGSNRGSQSSPRRKAKQKVSPTSRKKQSDSSLLKKQTGMTNFQARLKNRVETAMQGKIGSALIEGLSKRVEKLEK